MGLGRNAKNNFRLGVNNALLIKSFLQLISTAIYRNLSLWGPKNSFRNNRKINFIHYSTHITKHIGQKRSQIRNQ